MTMPHLMNCDHSETGWCLACVKAMGEELMDLRMTIMHVSNLTMEEVFEAGSTSESPDAIQINPKHFGEWREAMAEVSAVCKKYLI